MNQELILTIAELIVSVSALVLLKYAIPLVKNSIDEKKFNKIVTWVGEAVHAADQIMSVDEGSEKKKYVLNFIHKLLEENNIEISEEQLDILIEAAVKQIRLQDSKS